MPVLGLAIGFAVGLIPGMRKVTYPWVAGLIGAIGAPAIWALLTFVVTLLRTPCKLIAEKDALIEARDAQILDLTSGRRPLFVGDIGYGAGRERPTRSSTWPNGVAAELEITRDQEEVKEIRVYASVPVRRISGSIGGEAVTSEMIGQSCAVYRPSGLLSKGSVLKIILLTQEAARLVRVCLVRAGSDEE